MELTPKSLQHLEWITKRQDRIDSLTDPYFMKLLYVLLSRAEECVANLTISHATVPGVHVSNTYASNEVIDELRTMPMDHYVVCMKIQESVFDLDIYTTEPLGHLLNLVQLFLSLCVKSIERCHLTLYLVPFKPLESLNKNALNKDPEKVVFGKEEWFKTLIRECFSFCLDFEEMDYKPLIQPMFHLECEYRLDHALCEFWSRTLNVAVFSFVLQKDISYEAFERYFHINLNLERMFSLVQMKHYLSHVNLDYKDLIQPEDPDVSREVSGDVSFEPSLEDLIGFNDYVLSAILFYHFQQTMNWFIDHNETELRFSKKRGQIYMFCHYLNTIYAKDKFLKQIDTIKEFPKTIVRSIFEIKH